MSTAIAVVLLSGAVGFVLGVVYPPDLLMSHLRRVLEIRASGAPTAPAKAPAPSVTAPAPPLTAAAPDRAPATVPPPERNRDAAARTRPEALPQPATAPAPSPANASAVQDPGRVLDALGGSTKAGDKSSARPKPARRERAARPKRRKNTDTAEAQAKGPAEPPIVGPSTGFVLP
jgi:hypothetical protein